MSQVEMQAALARLYVDRAFFDVFLTDMEAALDRYSLTEAERSAIADIDREAVRKFGDSLCLKTFGRFKQPYKLLGTLDSKALYGCFKRFWALRPIKPNERFYEPILEFGEFLASSFEADDSVPAFASDLARYERRFWIARFGPRRASARSGEPGADTDAGDDPEVTSGSRPVVGDAVVVRRFGFDMARIEKALRAGESPEDVEEGGFHVVFKGMPRVGRAKKLQVTAAVARLIGLCDGERDLRGIAKELARGGAADGYLGPALKAVQRLTRSGVLEVRDR